MKTGGVKRGFLRPLGRPLAWASLVVVVPLLWSGSARAGEAPPIVMVDDKTVTISARDMDLLAFIELLATRYKLNIVPPKDLAGKVSVNFHQIAPLDALKAVLEANGYDYVLEKTETTPLVKIRTIPKVEGAVPLTMRTFVLNYTTASDVAKVCEGMLSKNGKLMIATGKNALVVQDLQENVQRVEEVVKLMDAAPRQVMIDAKIVELSDSDTRKIGIDWSMFQGMSIADIAAETSFVRNASWVNQNITGNPVHSTRDVVTTTGHVIDLRGGILDANDAHLVLDLFDTVTKSTIISRPSIRTLDNKPAHIISGQVVPIPLFDFAKDTGVRTLSGFQDEQIGVELTVTPHINEDGYITLDVNPKVESIDRYITVGGDEQRPVKNTRQATTNIRIKDGSTAVIGGLTASSTTVTTTGLPWLRDLPYVGPLFRKRTNEVVNTELLIFITPRTVKDDEPLTKVQDEFVKKVQAMTLMK